MVFHKHIMVIAKVRNPIRTEEEGIAFLTDLVSKVDMKIIKGPFASYVDKVGNRGLTAMVMIETSHSAFHIWDEQDPALLQFDLYTCGQLDTAIVLKALHDRFEIIEMDWKLYDRAVAFLMLDKGSTRHPQ